MDTLTVVEAAFTGVGLWMVLQIFKRNLGLGKIQDQYYPRNQTKRDNFCDTKALYM